MSSDTSQSTRSVSSAPQRRWTLREVQQLLWLIEVFGTHNWPVIARYLSCPEGEFADWPSLNVISKWDSLVSLPMHQQWNWPQRR